MLVTDPESITSDPKHWNIGRRRRAYVNEKVGATVPKFSSMRILSPWLEAAEAERDACQTSIAMIT
jgi:hypothetical protein